MKCNILHQLADNYEFVDVPKWMLTEIIRIDHEKMHFAAKKVKEFVMNIITKIGREKEYQIANSITCIISNKKKRGKLDGELSCIHG